MSRTACVWIDNRLRLKLTSVSSQPLKEVEVRLSRLQAQQLADALLEYAGATTKSANRDIRTGIPAEDITPLPEKPVKRGVVSLRSGTKRY